MTKKLLLICLTASFLLSLANADTEVTQFRSKLKLTVFARGNKGQGPMKIVGKTPSNSIKIPKDSEWGIYLEEKVDPKKLFAECIENGVYNIHFHFVLPKNYLRGIEKLEGLKTLTFFGTGVNDEDLARIAVLKNLESLTINGFNKVSSEGFAHILKLTNLERLDLSAVQLSDEELLSLKSHTQLKLLSVDKKKYSEDSLNRLKKALPECTIR